MQNVLLTELKTLPQQTNRCAISKYVCHHSNDVTYVRISDQQNIRTLYYVVTNSKMAL